jgi:uncharacterized delta-60 repeat protein
LQIWAGNHQGIPAAGIYTRWASGEPNNAYGNEDYGAHFGWWYGWLDWPSHFTERSIVQWTGEAVRAAAGVSTSVIENAAGGTVLGTLSAADPDSGESLAYSIVGSSSLFEINGNELRVKAGAAFDYETARQHLLTVRVTDSNGNTRDQMVAVDVVNANEAPTNTGVVGANNLISNGSFETDTTGWSLAGAGTSRISGQGATDGSFSIGFSGSNQPNDGVATTTFSTVAGSAYSVLFDVGAHGTTGVAQMMQFQVLGNTTLIEQTIADAATNPATFLTHHYTFVADSSVTTLRFTDISSTTIGVDFILDNVRAFAVETSNPTMSIAENSPNGTIVGQVASIDADPYEKVRYSFLDNAGGRFAINVSTGRITVANGSLLDYEAATSHNIKVRVTDAAGATFDKVMAVSVINTNDAPYLNTSANPTLGTVLEGATNPSGVTVASLVVDGSITDPDGTAVEAIAITGLNTSLGTWQYSLNGGTSWLTIDAAQINSTTNELALLLGPTAQLRLVPFGDLNGSLSDAITFRAWDMSSGSEGQYVAITSTGGSTAFSTASDRVSMAVTSVDDPPTFLVGTGMVTTDFNASDDNGRGVVIQPDGKFLVAGFSSNGANHDFALARYHADGSLDTSFGSSGKVTTPIGSGNDLGLSISLQADGKILVAGRAASGASNTFALVRYHADGALDNSFGNQGIVTTLFSAGGDNSAGGSSVSIQLDGKIVVGGFVGVYPAYDFALARYNSDGSLDTSFGTGGMVTATMGVNTEDRGYSVAIQPDGKIVLSGQYIDIGNWWLGSTGWDLALMRFNTDGSLDTSFGSAGKVHTDLSNGSDGGGRVTFQSDGKILVAGYAFIGGNYDFAVARYNVDGSLDTSFGSSGKLTTPVGSVDEFSQSITVQSDGKILIGGYGLVNGSNEFMLVRYQASGALDSTFGDGGKLITSLGSGNDYATHVTLQPDGKIVVAGTSHNGSNNDFAIVRYNADGSLDTTFGERVNTVTSSVSYTENGVAVVLASSAQVFDAENSISNFSGSTLTLARSGGANAQDLFSATGTLGALTQGSSLTVGGTSIGTVTTNSAGTLVLTFNSSATNALVNSAIQQIAYSNSSDAPPANVQVSWTLTTAPPPRFTEVTNLAGVPGTGNSNGSAWADYDGDGDLDLYVTNRASENVLHPWNILYRNNGDGTFTDVTSLAGVGHAGEGFHGAWGDYDGDGHLDLYVTNYTNHQAANILYRNNGNGTFTDMTSLAGVGGNGGYAVGGYWGDYDQDGDLDLYVTNWTKANLLYRNNGDGTFTDVAAAAGVGASGYSSYVGAWGDYDNDGRLDLFVSNFRGQANLLFRNNGDGTFANVTSSAGIIFTGGWGVAAAWGDYDVDGDLDLYIADHDRANVLYRNNGNGTFTDVAASAGVGHTGVSRNATWGDFDSDGDLDLYVINAFANILYRNNGNGTFTDITATADVGNAGNGFNGNWVDYDKDADLDLYVANNFGDRNVLYRNDANTTAGLSVAGQVTVNITGFNDAPIAMGELFQTNFLTPLTMRRSEWLANDTDAEGDGLTIQILTLPSHGSIVMDGNGGMTYRPETNFVGTVTLVYAVSDGSSSSLPATVEIVIAPPPAIVVATPVDRQSTNVVIDTSPAPLTLEPPTKVSLEFEKTTTPAQATSDSTILTVSQAQVSVVTNATPSIGSNPGISDNTDNPSLAKVARISNTTGPFLEEVVPQEVTLSYAEGIDLGLLETRYNRNIETPSMQRLQLDMDRMDLIEHGQHSFERFVLPEERQFLESQKKDYFVKTSAPIVVGTAIGAGISLHVLMTAHFGSSLLSQSGVFMPLDPLTILESSAKVKKSKEREDLLFEAAVCKTNPTE